MTIRLIASKWWKKIDMEFIFRRQGDCTVRRLEEKICLEKFVDEESRCIAIFTNNYYFEAQIIWEKIIVKSSDHPTN